MKYRPNVLKASFLYECSITLHTSALLQLCDTGYWNEGIVYDLDLNVKVKFNITNRFLRCGFLFMFNTTHNYVYLVTIRCQRLLKCGGTVYELDLKVKVKFDITNVVSYECSIHLMSILLQYGVTACCCSFNVLPMGVICPWFDLKKVIVAYLGEHF